MNNLIHLIKFNFIFNRMRIALIFLACLFIIGLSYFFNSETHAIGTDILQYSSSLIFFIVVGKVSLKSNMMFDIKHQQGLPLNKSEIVLIKSIADLVHFFPTSFVWTYGFCLSFPEYHGVFVFFISHIVLIMLNMLALNKRIDFARIQHSSASFKNSILFLNKYLNLHLQGGFVFIIFTLITLLAKKSIIKEYALFVFVCMLLILAYFSTLKMLKDESLSYFIPLRDFKRMGGKLIAIGLPVFFLFNFGGKAQKDNDLTYAQEIKKEFLKYKNHISGTSDLLHIAQGDIKYLEQYLKEKGSLPLESHVLGGKLPHIVAARGNSEVLKMIISKDSNLVHSLGSKMNRTPLFSALKSCQLGAVNILLKAGASIEHKDHLGNTPVIFAAKSRCVGGVLLLKKRGANLAAKNNKGQDLNPFLKKSGLASFWSLETTAKRSLASDKIKP